MTAKEWNNTETPISYVAACSSLIACIRDLSTVEQERDEAVRLLEKCKRSHYYCDDSWYSCPKAMDGCSDESKGDKCDCGADEHNAIIEAFLSRMKEDKK